MPANTIITTIKTSQAPDAKPIAKSIILTTTTVENGVGEVISPLICCNITANTATVDLRVHRHADNFEYFFLRNLQVPAFDTIPVPMNGQFFKTGDVLEIISDTDLAIHANLSFTLGQSEEDDV